jgi:flagellum-specific peptidoglycan hydrolase FlgJ
MSPSEFLTSAFNAATTAKHPFADYAACEAALESAWGSSKLATEAFNLFGRKQSHDHPVYETLDMPTKEFLHGQWITTTAHWVKYPTWAACFDDRVALLRRVPLYAPAFAATNGADFVKLVSEHWSTDPQRAEKVLAIYAHHKEIFS